MGKAAARWSDLVLVTSDNPRSESPEGIIEEILGGIREEDSSAKDPQALGQCRAGEKSHSSIVDRREAIRLAVRIAEAGDIVVIAGKGHEDVQILGDQRVPFRDDQEVARALRGFGNRESAVG
jgi:UDP-N-acetylmuramoyl-L-alanyl-D-glutamate--2,6-diaminopimelate ligase